MTRWAVRTFSVVLAAQIWRSWTHCTPGKPGQIIQHCCRIDLSRHSCHGQMQRVLQQSPAGKKNTKAIAIEITGSSIFQPVAVITNPETTTPAETTASAAMWRKAPLILRSFFLPAMNNKSRRRVNHHANSSNHGNGHAIHPDRGAQSANSLPNDDPNSHIQKKGAAQRTRIVAFLNQRCAWPSPNVWRRHRAQASSRVMTSLKLWPASAIRASELDIVPYPASTKTKSRLSTVPMAKARLKLLGE